MLRRWWQEDFNAWLDRVAEYLAHRKGLLPMLGLLLVLLNLLLQPLAGVPVLGPLVRIDLFLHLGVILAILGFLLAWAL